jgi:hypothetical protein
MHEDFRRVGSGLECFLYRPSGMLRRVNKRAKHRQARSLLKNNGKGETGEEVERGGGLWDVLVAEGRAD